MNRLVPLLALLVAAAAPAPDPGPAALLGRFAQAWNASDPTAIGALFAPDADLVTPDGAFPSGRAAIAAYYAAAFARGYAGSALTGKLIRQRPLAPGLILLDVQFAIAGAHRPNGSPLPEEHGAMAAVLRQDPNGWHILAQRERNGGDVIAFSGRGDRR